MKPEILVAWIETEGTFGLEISEKFNPRLSVTVSQVEKGVIHRIQQELGLGNIAVNNSDTYQLRIRKLADLEKLFILLDQVDEKDWYTHKLQEFKVSKEFLIWNKNRGKRITVEDIKKVLEYRKLLSPRATTDLTPLLKQKEAEERSFQEKLIKVQELLKKNMYIDEVAKELNYSPKHIYYLIEKYNIKRPILKGRRGPRK